MGINRSTGKLQRSLIHCYLNLELQTTTATTTFWRYELKHNKLCHRHYNKQRGKKPRVRFTYASSRLISYDHRNVSGGVSRC